MQRFQKIWMAAVIVLFVILQSCDSEEPEDVCNPSVNFPFLEVGNSWTYEYDDLFFGTGEFKATISESISPEMFRVEFQDALFYYPSELYFHSCGNSISSVLDINVDPATNIFVYSNPGIGTKWNGFNNGQKGNYEVIDKDIEITTDAGVFNCDKITLYIEGAINVDTFYFSREYNTIKYEGLFGGYELKSKNF